jgi:ATP-dependent helicase HepA
MLGNRLEGRNFQFAHHLVLWDIPADRTCWNSASALDRIGQTADVELHHAVLPGTAQALARWYADALDALRTSPADGRLFKRFGAR